MSARLIELEKSPSDEAYLEIAETVFREAHSLKGAARSAGMGEIENIFQEPGKCIRGLEAQGTIVHPGKFRLPA